MKIVEGGVQRVQSLQYSSALLVVTVNKWRVHSYDIINVN